MGNQQIIENINKSVLKTDLPPLEPGDTVNVHVRIVEGEKERIQIFSGVLIARHGRGINEMVTVRRVVDDVGIERKFPVHSPLIAKYEILRRGDARRAKLYFLRDRVGKSRRLRDRRRRMGGDAGSPGGSTGGEKGSAAFVIKKAKDGQFFFHLKAGNGQTILVSEMYKAHASAINGIESIKKNSVLDERYEKLSSKTGEPYFVLKAGNHEVIGTSEMYSAESGRDGGIASVKARAVAATIDDQSKA